MEEIGIVPEISNIYEELSAWDNLMFTGRLYGVSRGERERQAEELLRAFGLWEKRDVSSAGFSKGMKRRLCLAMGLMHRPHVLFLDEPTSGLDVQSALVIREMIRRLRDEGVTIFLTTHNIEEASQSCDRVAIINYGKLAAVDSPENLRAAFAGMQSVEVAFVGGDAAMPATLIRWPLLFVSGVFIPLAALAWWGKALAYLSPLTYANDIIQRAMGGDGYLPPALDAAALLVFWAVFLLAGLRLHEVGRQRGL